MTDTANNTNLRPFRLGLMQWILIPLLCLAGAAASNASVDSKEQPSGVIAIASDLSAEQAQDDQWDLDALTPIPYRTAQTGSILVVAGTVIVPRHQVLTAFIPRAPPYTSPKTRTFVF